MSEQKQILEVLRRHEVPFVVVGGHAVNYHGYARNTEDVDVVWLRSPEAETKLLGALSEIEACFIGKEIDPATKIERTYPVSLGYIRASHLMMLTTKLGFLDIFDYIPGFTEVDPQELFDSSVVESELHYPSIDWLRKMKKASGRTKDLLDLENLED